MEREQKETGNADKESKWREQSVATETTICTKKRGSQMDVEGQTALIYSNKCYFMDYNNFYIPVWLYSVLQTVVCKSFSFVALGLCSIL